ncbi:uncharacterized protein FOMMEDRAFT_169257 [Fomitiporia mediterranea MF3/22]|uniref:uncharacterized protein n=1 Tax=Fomitiporia mediterranea (strain MF3/22) TaxID=694068 RepID=UPI0004409A70|nr:uncharacterized protein FOMMEDRAFT_169257 [Fomitiporia mediterranea MF3/22]EJD01062.1 hypothetical protein FOMMEDRAFT_169257 [Fomitiporia mediterranea MF3/22]
MAQPYHQGQDSILNSTGSYTQLQQQPQSNVAHSFTRKTGAIRSRDWEPDMAKPGSSRLRREIPFMSASVASSTINRFLAIRVREEGFERAETAALVRLEMEVTAFIEQIFSRAKAFADNSARGRPTAADAIAAVQEYDLDIAELKQEVKESKKRARKRKRAGEPDQSLNLELVPPERRSSSPELLASDDENTPPVVPQTLRSLPTHLPPLPPKHTYLQTPVPPPKKQALPSLEKKLENAALVQESLRNLLLATEVNADANDKELFGGVVNWEATKYPRKKWKIGGS